DLRRRAEEKKTASLGSGIGGLIARPKPEDVVLVATQRRLEPFWHVACHAHYAYDRTRTYTIPASALDVRSVTLLGEDFGVVQSGKAPPAFMVSLMEHCTDDIRDEVFVDGQTGAAMGNGAALITGPRTEVMDPATLGEDGTIVVPPEQRASAIVRQLLAKMLRPLQADTVHEESLAMDHIELFYRPIVAFEFQLPAKDRKGVVEIDAISGEAKTAASLKLQITRRVSRDALFDIGADTVGLLVPGGSIAVKLARVALDKGY
ncbi:MAG: hypothetical protein MUQ32_15450, partial [Chloroflexi bacterium]|nr:hypothetical protein [Chloroflexota bacterium]